QFLFHQFGVAGAVRGVNQALHGEALVFTAHRVGGVESLVVLGQIQSIVPGHAERFVCNRGVPVAIFRAVLRLRVKVDVDRIGVFVRRFFYQVVIELVVLVAADGLEVGLGQVNVVELAGLVQLEGNIVGLYHSDCNGVEQFGIGIPVAFVLGENFFVALDVR